MLENWLKGACEYPTGRSKPVNYGIEVENQE